MSTIDIQTSIQMVKAIFLFKNLALKKNSKLNNKN